MWKLIYQFSSPFCDTVSTNIHQPASDLQPQLEHWEINETTHKIQNVLHIQYYVHHFRNQNLATELSSLIHLMRLRSDLISHFLPSHRPINSKRLLLQQLLANINIVNIGYQIHAPNILQDDFHTMSTWHQDIKIMQQVEVK